MKPALFIARRLAKPGKRAFSAIIHRIAVASIALGLAVMIVAFHVLFGYQQTIGDKVYSLGGHLQANSYSMSRSLEEQPISLNNALYLRPDSFPGVAHVMAYAHKGALAKKDQDVYGVVMKGVDDSWSQLPFAENKVAGTMDLHQGLKESHNLLLSSRFAQKLQVKLGDTLALYFVQNPPRARLCPVVGLFDTGMEEFDERTVICDLNLLRRLNQWADTTAGGMEIHLDHPRLVEEQKAVLEDALPFDVEVERVQEKYFFIFDWLALLDNNVRIFLILILVVACFNMVTVLLILIMERTPMIGTLKALGGHDIFIQRVFVIHGLNLVLRGLFLGNAIGLGFSAVQYFFRLVPLDPSNYYVSYVPIAWSWPMVLAVNAGLFALVAVVLQLPALVISRFQPIKAIRFD